MDCCKKMVCVGKSSPGGYPSAQWETPMREAQAHPIPWKSSPSCVSVFPLSAPLVPDAPLKEEQGGKKKESRQDLDGLIFTFEGIFSREGIEDGWYISFLHRHARCRKPWRFPPRDSVQFPMDGNLPPCLFGRQKVQNIQGRRLPPLPSPWGPLAWYRQIHLLLAAAADGILSLSARPL